MRKGNLSTVILVILIVIPYVAAGFILLNKKLSVTKIDNSNIVIIDKTELKLNVFNYRGKLINKFPVSLGTNYGNKTARNDLKTPQGIFRIMSVEDASEWSFDFEDDYEPAIVGAYGPYFIRLEVPGQRGIGIHGNLERYPIGARNSHGCIRMENPDLEKFVRLINPGGIVVIVPSLADLKEDSIISAATIWKVPDLEIDYNQLSRDSMMFIEY